MESFKLFVSETKKPDLIKTTAKDEMGNVYFFGLRDGRPFLSNDKRVGFKINSKMNPQKMGRPNGTKAEVDAVKKIVTGAKDAKDLAARLNKISYLKWRPAQWSPTREAKEVSDD